MTGISQSTGAEAWGYGEGKRNARKQTSGELRVSSPAESDWFWIAGYYYMKSDNSTVDMEQDPTTYYDNRYHTAKNRNPIISHALFAQTTYPVTDWFRATGGIRASTDKQDMEYRIGLSDTEGNVLYDRPANVRHS